VKFRALSAPDLRDECPERAAHCGDIVLGVNAPVRGHEQHSALTWRASSCWRTAHIAVGLIPTRLRSGCPATSITNRCPRSERWPWLGIC